MPGRLTYADRLLAEAVRVQESGGLPIDEPGADDTARSAGGTFEQRIVRRARALAIAPALRIALDQVGRAATGFVMLAALLSLFSGAAAARTALGASGDRPVNFYLVVIGLLGVQLVLLLLWLAGVIVRPRLLTGGSLGGLVLMASQRVAGWLHRGPAHFAALQALGTALAASRVGRWTISAISHLIWLAFNIGAIAVVVVLLSARDYTFTWETTILSERTYVPLTRALAAGPRAVGFPVPDEEQIRASRALPSADDGNAKAEARRASEAWSGLLVGLLVLYGLAPRALLLLLSLAVRQRAMRGHRLDTSLPGFRRLEQRLMPQASPLGIVDGDGDDETSPGDGAAATDRALPERPPGPPALIGWELAQAPPSWPPLPGARWLDLGLIDDRAGATRAVRTLREAPGEPAMVVIVCELASTPDRGVQRFVEQVARSVRSPVTLVLTGGQRMRERAGADHLALRADDWRRLAAGVGVDAARVLEIDLEHLTDRSAARLAALLDGAAGVGGTPAAARHIEQALALIIEHRRRWTADPSAQEQADLQTAIARLYRPGAETWQRLLRAAPRQLAAGGDVSGHFRRSAEQVISFLPPRLRSSPRWLAAGAVSGAIGCVAAASLIAPVAIGALPIWTGLGAALAAVVRMSIRGGGGEPPAEAPGEPMQTAVRAAALFAVLLEVQGRGEAAISRIIDETFADEAGDPGASPDQAAAWLAEIGHRLDLALARAGAAS